MLHESLPFSGKPSFFNRENFFTTWWMQYICKSKHARFFNRNTQSEGGFSDLKLPSPPPPLFHGNISTTQVQDITFYLANSQKQNECKQLACRLCLILSHSYCHSTPLHCLLGPPFSTLWQVDFHSIKVFCNRTLKWLGHNVGLDRPHVSENPSCNGWRERFLQLSCRRCLPVRIPHSLFVLLLLKIRFKKFAN